MYEVFASHSHVTPWGVTNGARAVDYYRTLASARHHAMLLNRNVAYVDSHRPLGSRVMPTYGDGVRQGSAMLANALAARSTLPVVSQVLDPLHV